MSLMERVRSAGLDEVTPLTQNATEELRKKISVLLPPQRLAQLASDNPRQAESEIRSAAEQVFAESPWLAMDDAAPSALIESLVNDVFGLGPLEPYLADDTVTEIMVNGTQSLFIEREGKNVACPVPFANDEALRTLIDRIIGPLGRRIDEANPMVDARLASGHRVNAVIPPIALDGPVLTIRKFSREVLRLQDLEVRGSLDASMRQFLVWAIAARKNIAVCGGTGTGKTTLLNSLSCEIPHEERIVTIEDSAELRFLEHPHVVRMEARPENAEGKGEVTIRDLVKNSLRMRPDRIIVGEVRGGEALDMLNAMNTGHDGSLTTLHSNSPADAVMRLSTMVRFVAELPLDAIEAQIGSALDLIVHVSRFRDGSRRISQVCEVTFDRTNRTCVTPILFDRPFASDTGVWRAAPYWFEQIVDDGIVSREEVLRWMEKAHLLPSAA